ncbi:MAG: riboflavin synthase [Verrucomicrobiota bacterium]|jgi:riboflavin synthase|nr:riboflavin synthase [Verrucomicrobiota bacterium]
MFTGIIEETGAVESIHPGDKSVRLTVSLRKTGLGLSVGDSLSVNGCCLTVVEIGSKGRSKMVQFDLLKETWNLTNLKDCRAGSAVNLERSLEAGGRLGGHFVTGHIDGTGKIMTWEQKGEDYQLQVSAPDPVMRYVVHKGSIAVDGISLTVAAVEKSCFTIWIIPHTFNQTTLKERAVGDAVNLEADMLGKYVERFIAR